MEIKGVNVYSDGVDNIYVNYVKDRNYCLLIGNTKINGKYRILLTKIDAQGKILWSKTYGERDEYEAQTIVKFRNKFLIGGNAHGKATESGGENWHAYLLLVDSEGNKITEKSYRIGENDAVYNIWEDGNYLYCFGETKRRDGRYVFVMQINENFEIVNIWKYGPHEDVLAGGLTSNFLSYSCKKNGSWFGKVIRINKDHKILWKREFKDVLIYSMSEHDDRVLLAGSKNNCAWILSASTSRKIEEEILFENGSLSNITTSKGKIIVSGEKNEYPTVCVLNEDLKIVDEFIYPEKRGWFENSCLMEESKILAMGYSSQTHKAFMTLIERE